MENEWYRTRNRDDFAGGRQADPNTLRNINGTLFFSAYDEAHGRELWSYDDTRKAVRYDLLPGAIGSDPQEMIGGVSGVFFSAFDEQGTRRLWRGVRTTPLSVDEFADESDGDYSVGDLSLREAIALANFMPGPDTVSFSSEAFNETRSIELSLGEIRIADSVNLRGPGTGLLTIRGQVGSRVFNVNDDVDSHLLDVTIDA